MVSQARGEAAVAGDRVQSRSPPPARVGQEESERQATAPGARCCQRKNPRKGHDQQRNELAWTFGFRVRRQRAWAGRDAGG